MDERTAEVAGAGLGGLYVASALARHGWNVRVHERAAEPRTFGAGIWLWENGLRALQGIDAYDETVSRSILATAYETYDSNGKMIRRRNFGSRDRLIVPPRQQLFDALLQSCKRAGVEIVASSPVEAATPWGDLVLQGGKTISADLVIGADGVNSHVGDSLGLRDSVVVSPLIATRRMIPRIPEDNDSIIEEHWSAGRGFLYNPSSDTEIYICTSGPVGDASVHAVPFDKKIWRRYFPHLSHVIDRIDNEGRSDRVSNVRCSRWSVGRVAIIGDAAHAQPAFLGQAANLAFCNGWALAEILGDSPPDMVPTMLRRWETAMRPLTDHTQRLTNLYGTIRRLWPPEFEGTRSKAWSISTRIPWVANQLDRAAHFDPLQDWSEIRA